MRGERWGGREREGWEEERDGGKREKWGGEKVGERDREIERL